MLFKHHFKAAINWTFNQNKEESGRKFHNKRHQIKIEGKPVLDVSAAKAFKGDSDHSDILKTLSKLVQICNPAKKFTNI